LLPIHETIPCAAFVDRPAATATSPYEALLAGADIRRSQPVTPEPEKATAHAARTRPNGG
jgi:hypothetical protein